MDMDIINLYYKTHKRGKLALYINEKILQHVWRYAPDMKEYDNLNNLIKKTFYNFEYDYNNLFIIFNNKKIKTLYKKCIKDEIKPYYNMFNDYIENMTQIMYDINCDPYWIEDWFEETWNKLYIKPDVLSHKLH